MSNEILFVVSALVGIGFVFFSSRRGTEWLFGSIAVNLILIAVFGAKLVTVFGLVTNAGNVFYACVFLATHFILERRGKVMGMKTIWYGVAFMFFFAAMSQLAARFSGAASTSEMNDAVWTLFSFSPRVIFASVIAYAFAQYVNILVYEWLKKKTAGKFLWLRSNAANIVSQLLDSLLFFSIAFVDLAGPLLVQAILAGWLVKILVICAGTPFLYLDARLEKKNP